MGDLLHIVVCATLLVCGGPVEFLFATLNRILFFCVPSMFYLQQPHPRKNQVPRQAAGQGRAAFHLPDLRHQGAARQPHPFAQEVSAHHAAAADIVARPPFNLLHQFDANVQLQALCGSVLRRFGRCCRRATFSPPPLSRPLSRERLKTPTLQFTNKTYVRGRSLIPSPTRFILSCFIFWALAQRRYLAAKEFDDVWRVPPVLFTPVWRVCETVYACYARTPGTHFRPPFLSCSPLS